MAGKKWFRRSALLAVGLAACAALAVAAPQSTAAPLAVLFQDNMENGINGWTTSFEAQGTGATCLTAEWHQSSNPGDAHSPDTAWTNTGYQPSGSGSCLNYLTSPSPGIATPLGSPQLTLTFWEKHHTEGGEAAPGVPFCNPPGGTPPCDFGIVQVSANGGPYLALPDNDFPTRFEGITVQDFTYKQITFEIGPAYFTPGNTINIRFAFSSDALAASPPFLGWFIDDVVVQTGPPTSVSIASFSGRATGNAVALRWRTASEIDALGFNVWRFANGKGVKVNRSLVAAKGQTGGASYQVVDRLARRGVAHTYRLQVVAKNGKRAFRASAIVPAR